MITGTSPSSFGFRDFAISAGVRRLEKPTVRASVGQRCDRVRDRGIPEQVLVDAGVVGPLDLGADLRRAVVDAEREVLEPRDDRGARAANVLLEVLERAQHDVVRLGVRVRRRRTRPAPSATGRPSARRSRGAPPSRGCPGRPRSDGLPRRRRPTRRGRRGTASVRLASRRGTRRSTARAFPSGPGRPSSRAGRPAGARSRRGSRRRPAFAAATATSIWYRRTTGFAKLVKPP